MREYERNKYAVIKYQTFDESWTTKKDKINLKTQIMDEAKKLVKYTQGENESKTKMNITMPVFASFERMEGKAFMPLPDNKPVPLEVEIFMRLPREYQLDKIDTKKTVIEAPKPIDTDIHIEVIEPFKVYVK